MGIDRETHRNRWRVGFLAWLDSNETDEALLGQANVRKAHQRNCQLAPESRMTDSYEMRRSLIGLASAALLIATLASPASAGSKKDAESRLRNGMVAAETFWSVGDTFVGFNATAAAAIEPALEWVDATQPSGEQVDIQVVKGQRVLLITQASSGRFFSMCARNPRWESPHSVTASLRYGKGNTFSAVDEFSECRLKDWKQAR